MPTSDRDRLLEEAVDLLLRQHEAPGDAATRAAIDAWLARGPDHRSAFETAKRAWGATTTRPRRRRATLTLAAVGALAAIMLAGPELWLQYRADHVTGLQPHMLTLSSGDRVVLDAGTAIAVAMDTELRQVSVLRGAAFFAVEKEARGFQVLAGDASVHVLGTSFEVAMLEGTTQVGVAEGEVAVRTADTEHQLTAGDQIRISVEGEASRSALPTGAFGAWRSGRLVVEDAPLNDVAAIIDRRIRGPVMVLDSDVAAARITGSFDLNRPETALATLAAVGGARVTSIPLGLTILTRD